MRLNRFYLVIFLSGCQLKTPIALIDNVPTPEITSFSINGIAGIISGLTIKVDLRWTGIPVTNLTAIFVTSGKKIFVDGTEQVSGVTNNNFITPRAYNAMAADGSVSTYTVTVQGGFPFADSGQILCSSGVSANGAMAACPNTSIGSVQDGDFTSVPFARSFTGPTQHATFTNDYTTKDNVTGLVWRSCSEGQSGANCTTGSALKYTLSPDTTTCGALNSANAGAGYAGLTNWRLPTIEELATLSKYDGSSPTIDTTNFPSTAANSYWSATTYVPSPIFGWYFNFSAGVISSINKANAFQVRCVSNNPVTYSPSRTDAGDGTIRDDAINLIWQKCSMGLNNDSTCSGSATAATWLQALAYCQSLTLAGRPWRLPNIRELQSLVNYSQSNPAISGTFFPATVASSYWSSSTSAGTPANAWTANFFDGLLISTVAKSSTATVRCIATGP